MTITNDTAPQQRTSNAVAATTTATSTSSNIGNSFNMNKSAMNAAGDNGRNIKIRVISVGLLDDHSLDPNKMYEVSNANFGMTQTDYTRLSNQLQETVSVVLTPSLIEKHNHRLYKWKVVHPLAWLLLVVLFIVLMVTMKQCNVHDEWNEAQKTILMVVVVVFIGYGHFLKFESRSLHSSLLEYRTKREKLCH